jgi:predicted RNA polymerase sigma factor
VATNRIQGVEHAIPVTDLWRPSELLAERLAAVLGVIYRLFDEGYVASASEQILRPDLCAEALRLDAC